MPEIIVIAHNIRSTHNVGAIFRTCEGLGISQIICSGYTPYPKCEGDKRLPHIVEKLTKQIHTAALGAEAMVPFEHVEDLALLPFKTNGYRIVGLEQSKRSVHIDTYKVPTKLALVIGEEVNGINNSLLSMCDDLIEIPMKGKKESFNVSVATGITLFQLTR